MIAAILIVAFIKLYNINHEYQQITIQKTKEVIKLKQTTQQKINLLEKKVISYENKVNELEKKIKKIPTIKKKEINNNCIEKIKHKKSKHKKLENKYKKLIMQNIHHQILQELEYAPYLPVSQLQQMMQKRFILKDITFKISIKTTSKTFSGIKITKDKTASIIRDSELLEVKFDTK
jgi:vacuolar-type H+-ATPase subunit I/STV1